MGTTIAVVNKKGGVGKTTTVINLAASLCALGKKALVVDTDPQANACLGLGIDIRSVSKSLYDCLAGTATTQEAVVATDTENLYVLPSHPSLVVAERELLRTNEREKRMQELLHPLRDGYDYIFLDCSPSLGLITVNALTAADTVIIPLQCEYFALSGMTQLLNTVKIIRNRLNPGLEIEGFLITMFDARMRQSQAIRQAVLDHFRELVFETVIRRSSRLSESQRFAKPMITYDAGSTGAQDYMRLAAEILERADKG
ncbi:ParA family protein [Dysgonomonas reticulitermitis]